MAMTMKHGDIVETKPTNKTKAAQLGVFDYQMQGRGNHDGTIDHCINQKCHSYMVRHFNGTMAPYHKSELTHKFLMPHPE